MKNSSMNKFQLLTLLMPLLGISITLSNAASPSSSNYEQWKSEQQMQDQALKKTNTPAKSGTASQNHYLSKPALSGNSITNSQKIRLNSASAEQFQQLNGIGLKKAEAIVAYRTKNGKFKSIEEIQEVKGIGPAIFAKNKERLGL
ncbi:competence protein ComE [Acinetobacter sp. ANC 3813]|nr:competence protein ComE [Acinetobacter sp. ANC 3813]